jgi:hypothetical protein
MSSGMSENYYFLASILGRRVANSGNSNCHITQSKQLYVLTQEVLAAGWASQGKKMRVKLGGLWFVLTGLCGRVGYLLGRGA